MVDLFINIKSISIYLYKLKEIFTAPESTPDSSLAHRCKMLHASQGQKLIVLWLPPAKLSPPRLAVPRSTRRARNMGDLDVTWKITQPCGGGKR